MNGGAKLKRCVALLAQLRAAMSGSEACWCADCSERWTRRIDRALGIEEMSAANAAQPPEEAVSEENHGK